MELAMERRSGLVLPTIGYELDREEMSYVDGGFYLNNNICNIITGVAVSILTLGAGIVMFASLVYPIGAIISANLFLFSLAHPMLTALLVVAGKKLIEIGISIAMAAVSGRGVDFSLLKLWFIPIGVAITIC